MRAAFLTIGLGVLLVSGCGGSSVSTHQGATGTAGAPSANAGAAGEAVATAGAFQAACGDAGATGGDAGASAGTAAGGALSGGGTGVSGSSGSAGSDTSGCPVECQPCGPGYVKKYVTGECCFQCIPYTDCMNGQAKYLIDREPLLKNARLACTTDAECAVLLPLKRCGASGCDYHAVSASVVDSLRQELSDIADKDCSSCMDHSLPACGVPNVACVESACVLAQ